MIKGKSKFDSEMFYGDYDNWMGFNKQKYTKEQAIESVSLNKRSGIIYLEGGEERSI